MNGIEDGCLADWLLCNRGYGALLRTAGGLGDLQAVHCMTFAVLTYHIASFRPNGVATVEPSWELFSKNLDMSVALIPPPRSTTTTCTPRPLSASVT